MSKDKTRRLTLFDSTDLAAAEEYFTRMAEKGWLLKKFSLFSLFTRCEPKKLRFSVQILLPKRRKEYAADVKGYTDLCEEAGWRYLSGYTGMHVFASEKEDVPEIVTDPAERIAAVSTQSKTGIIALFIASLVFLPGVIGLFSNLIHGESLLSQIGYEIPCALCMTSVLLLACAKTDAFSKWRSDAEKAAEKGIPIRYFGMRETRLRTVLFFVVLAAILIAMVLFEIGLRFNAA
ncbi:MAG: DUF2812 domain-containing protein [Clostridia bacterium]|nr:DUF2812 domain-containing protein [Clostridia bacterium]